MMINLTSITYNIILAYRMNVFYSNVIASDLDLSYKATQAANANKRKCQPNNQISGPSINGL